MAHSQAQFAHHQASMAPAEAVTRGVQGFGSPGESPAEPGVSGQSSRNEEPRWLYSRLCRGGPLEFWKKNIVILFESFDSEMYWLQLWPHQGVAPHWLPLLQSFTQHFAVGQRKEWQWMRLRISRGITDDVHRCWEPGELTPDCRWGVS